LRALVGSQPHARTAEFVKLALSPVSTVVRYCAQVLLRAISMKPSCVAGYLLTFLIEDELTLAALRMALRQRSIQPGLVHHSDRGSQYASNDYTDLLKGMCCNFRVAVW
jgi:transposase InsO family protein